MLQSVALILFIGLFAGILVALEVGYRIGRHGSKRNPERGFEGVGAIEAAIFSLLGLLLAFSFSGATARFDARRQLIVQEANAIATAYQRLDLAPTDQAELHGLFRGYVDARVQGFQQILDRPVADEQFTRAAQIEKQIWTRALAAAREDPTQNVSRLLLPALNQMSDVANQRTIALETYMPEVVFWLLVGVVLMSGILAGHAMARRPRRSWLHMLLFCSIISLTITVMFDFNYPRYGLIRIDAADRLLLQLRDSMPEPSG
jgi:hypothetical protein